MAQPRSNRYWWACKCGAWSWADRPQCIGCGATAPSWAQPYQKAANGRSSRSQSAGRRADDRAARSATGNAPQAVTIGDFVCVPNNKRGRRAAKRAANDLARANQEVADLKAKLEHCENATAAGEQTGCDANGKPQADSGNGGGLSTLTDEALDTLAKAFGDTVDLPGRDACMAEQKRRKDAKLASMPVHVRVKQGTEKWKKAEERVSKAEAALRAATAAIDAARKEAERLMVELTAKAEVAAQHLADRRSEAAAARDVVDQAIAADTVATKNASAVPEAAVAFHPGSVAWERASTLCSFITDDVMAALAAAGMPPEQLMKVQKAQADMRLLAAEKASEGNTAGRPATL